MSLHRWTLAVWWCVPGMFVLFLAAPSVFLPGDSLGLRRFQTPPLGSDLRLGQTFAMTGEGLHAIEVVPAAPSRGVQGDVRFELYELQDGQQIPVRTLEVPVEDVVRGRSYRFEFAPISDSKDRTYRLDLVAAPAEGVAFWATKGERYEGGSLYANGRARWADLAFSVHAPAPSIWGRLMTLRETRPARAYLVMLPFAASWLILGLVLRALPAIVDESAHTDSPRAS